MGAAETCRWCCAGLLLRPGATAVGGERGVRAGDLHHGLALRDAVGDDVAELTGQAGEPLPVAPAAAVVAVHAGLDVLTDHPGAVAELRAGGLRLRLLLGGWRLRGLELALGVLELCLGVPQLPRGVLGAGARSVPAVLGGGELLPGGVPGLLGR